MDFDGTLAPIVEDPAQALPLSGAGEVLERLASRFARVAVISGRPVSYLASKLEGAGSTELVGLYGMERYRATPPRVEVDPGASQWQARVEAVASAAEAAVAADDALGDLGIERKGLSVTLHYRKAPRLADWVGSFAAAQAQLSGLVAHPAKMSVELRPPSSTDKGTMVMELAAGLKSVCFVGDDVGDVPAFEALADLRAQGTRTLAVAVAGEEAPPALTERADLVVDGPGGVLDLLRALAGAGSAA